MPRLATCILALLLLPAPASAIEPAAFFEQHCIRCHGAEKQKGDLRLDSPPADPAVWLEIADRLEFAEMPPEDEPQPLVGPGRALVRRGGAVLGRISERAG